MNYLPLKLTKLRKHYSYSQSYVAKVLGVDVIEYMNYENGNSMLNYEQCKRLSNLYHIEVSEIFRNDENVTLYEIENQNTDEVNVAYFTNEIYSKNRFKYFLRNHKIASSLIVVLILAIVVLTIFLSKYSKPYENNLVNINRLSVSDTTVIYIDDNGAIGFSGSNSNGQLNGLASSNARKVCEGEGFSVILQADGTLISSGLVDNYKKEISELKNIVDVVAGKNHVVALDSNGRVYCIGDNKACEADGSKNISRVFASDNASILLDESGNLSYYGSFIGSSLLKSSSNILDIDSSDNILVILNSDNTLTVEDKNGSYIKAEGWSEIVDVCCGNDFVAGLDAYGKVTIEINNDEIKQEVNSWSGIIAIDAGKDYLIGFDGKNIYGVGNNDYNQFSKETKQRVTLEKVSDVSYTFDESNIYIQFKGVNNADGYLVKLDVGTGLSKRVSENEVVSFSCENMIEGKYYTISINALGSGDFKDSDVYSLDFIYEKPVMIEVKLTDYLGGPIEDLQNYLTSLGIEYISEISEEVVCDGQKAVVDIVNFEDGYYSRQELENIVVEYICCKVE